jgi:hypothetical protein
MKPAKYLDEKMVVERGVKALHRELGPVEARRFIAIARHKHGDSVARHREWQENLNVEEFISQIMAEYKK